MPSAAVIQKVLFTGIPCLVLLTSVLGTVALAGAEEMNVKPNAVKAAQAYQAPAHHEGSLFQHPTGISFWYPSGWRYQMLSGIVQLVPPGVTGTADDYETYYITAENVAMAGISSPDHPTVLPYLEEQMQALGQELGVVFQRTGGAQAVSTSQGNGLRYDWQAQSNLGPVQARTYVCIVRDYGFVLAGVAVKDLLARREKEVMRIVSSFGVGAGKLDQRLVGTWRLTSTYALQNDSPFETAYSKAKMASEDTSTLSFRPDGTWSREDTHQMIAGAGGVWLESNDRSASRGRWNADGNGLFLLWEDQSFADYRYRLQGNELRMESGKRGETWTRAQ